MTVVHALSFPQKYPPNFVESSRSKLRPNLCKILTYSEYWRDQIEKYNRSAHEPIDSAHVFHTLVTTHEKTAELDLLASAIRQLGHVDDPEETIMLDVIRHVAQAQGIIFGENAEKDTLEAFGYQE